MATYKTYFADAGVASTGLTPVWGSLTKVSDGTAFTPQPTFTELAGGWYKFTLSPSEDLVGVIDGSATLTTDSDRYVPVDFTALDGALDAAVSSRSTLAELRTALGVSATDTIAELAQGIPDAEPSLADAVMLLYMALRNKATATNSEKAIYADDGTKIAKKSIADDGTTYTEDEMASGA